MLWWTWHMSFFLIAGLVGTYLLLVMRFAWDENSFKNKEDGEMWNKKLYLAHPFASRAEIRKWELYVEKKYKINLLNPFYDVPDQKKKHEETDPVDIVSKNLKQLRKCKALIGLITDDVYYEVVMEIVYANLYKIPVYLIVMNGDQKHPWLLCHSKKIFTSFRSFEQFLLEGKIK